MAGLQIPDLLSLLLYFVVIAFIGLYSAKRVKSMADFVMPRRSGRIMMIMFSFGTGTHSDQAVSVASKSYTNGLSGIWYQWLWLFATPFFWLIAPMMRRFRALTTADVFEARYNRSVSMLFAVVGLLQYVVNIGVMLKGASIVIDTSTGGALNADWAIIIMTVLFVTYGVAGGLGAAIITDLVQGVLTVIFSFMLLPCVLNAVGGMAGMKEVIAEVAPGRNMFSLVAPEEIGVFYIIVIAFNALVGIVTQPHTMGNCAAGRTELDGQVGFMFGCMLKRLCTVAWCLTGLAAVAYFARQGVSLNPDEVFGTLAHDFLPMMLPGMLGLFIAALLASVMSSCDAFMVSCAGLFAENIYKPLVAARSERHYLWVARIASLLVVTAGVIFAYRLESVVKGLEIFWKVSPMMAVAFWLGLYWRRTSVAGAWASTIAAFTAWWLTTKSLVIGFVAGLPIAEGLRFIFVKDGIPEIYLPWQMIFYLTAGLLAGMIVSLLTKPVDKAKLDNFYALVRTPVRPGEKVDKPCTLPSGAVVPAKRNLISAAGLEIPVPTLRGMAGFLVGWLIVAGIIYIVYLIAQI